MPQQPDNHKAKAHSDQPTCSQLAFRDRQHLLYSALHSAGSQRIQNALDHEYETEGGKKVVHSVAVNLWLLVQLFHRLLLHPLKVQLLLRPQILHLPLELSKAPWVMLPDPVS